MKDDHKIKDTSKISFSMLKRYTAAAIVLWTIVIAGSLAWDIHHENKDAIELAKNEAKTIFRKDLAFRTWAASHGGVYVPPDDRTPPNPYLSHVPDRDVTTTTGKSFTLMNPAYVMRQVMEDYSEQYGVTGHITSLKLLNPKNAPDEWERNTLLAFEQGINEMTEIIEIDGISHLRFMEPLITEESCLKCHSGQGYKVGDVRGGVSVSVPMTTFNAMKRESIGTQLWTHGMIFFLGLGGIGFVSIRSKQRIIERMQSHEELRKAAEEWRTTFDSITDFISICDEDYRLVRMNRAFADIFKKKPEELLGKPCYEIVHGTNEPPPNCPHEKTMKTKKPTTVEFFEPRLGIHLEISASPVFNEKGEAVASVHVMRDITEQKRAEEDIRKFKTIADNTAYGVAISDMTGHLIYANDSYAQMHGYTVDELIGQNIFALYPENQQEFMTRRIERIKETGSAVGELIRKRKDGTIFPTLSTGTLVKDDQGKPLYIASSHFDLTERKKTEEALQISEDKFSRAFHSNPYPMSLVTMEEGRYLDVNDSYVQIFGFSREELLGRTTVEIGIAKTGGFRRILLQILDKKQGVKNLEVEFYTKSGRKVDALLSADKIEIGGETCLLSVINDITERKRAEEEVAKFKLIADNATYGVVIRSRDNTFSYVNESFAAMHGYTRDELIGQHYSILFNDEQKTAVDEMTARQMKTNKTISQEHWRIRKDGTSFLSHAIGTVVRDEKGEPLFIESTVIDITESKRAEEEISKFKTIADEASYGVVISDLDNIIVYVNATFADWHGYKIDELIGQPLSILFAEDQYKVLTERRKKILQTGRITPAEIWRKKKDGTIFSTLSSGSIVKDDKGRPVYIAATHFDLTERKKMEEQLMVTDRLASIGELASGIAHEINNPLTSVIGFTELLAEREVPDDIKDDLLFINKEAQRTAQIVQNLLTFARKHKQEKELVNINDAILNVLELRAYELRVNKIEVNTQLATDLPKVMANIFQLQQVFLNLIINAEYFMIKEHNRGNLTITTETVGNLVRTSIADDGPGVAKDDIEHLFDPFFTTKEVGKGTGLGLSICHGIITEHDGRIYVESKPGKGATFIVELPVFKKRQKEVK